MIKYKVEIKIINGYGIANESNFCPSGFTTEVEAEDEFDLEAQVESIVESKAEEQGCSHAGYDYEIKSEEKL